MSHPCGVYSDLFYCKSPRMVGVVVKALEGREVDRALTREDAGNVAASER